ncbi:phage portal protein, partial [Salmonella enterica subsp. enterica serovar Typhimurium]|uniref:phage portal protein n=1 Tax=Salmonella enterica TaxID=28901 RepID=UPI000CC32907
MVNYAKVIVDSFNGYFNGIPVKTSHDDEKVSEAITTYAIRSTLDDRESELAKMPIIYGHAFEYMYQDEEANTKVVETSPLDTFIVYDDSIAEEPLFAVRYQFDH